MTESHVPLASVRGVVVGLAGLTAISALALGVLAPVRTNLALVGVLVVCMALGEISRLVLPGRRESAPVATAAGLALIMSGSAVGGGPEVLPIRHILVVVAVGLGLGAVVRRLRRRRVGLPEIGARYLALALAAFLYRDVQVAGVSAVEVQRTVEDQRWVVALLMLVVAAAATAVELALTALCRAEREHAPLGPTVKDEFAGGGGPSAALLTVGPLIALAERAMGVAAVPLCLIPLVLTLFAARRYAQIRRTYGETIRALSRLTDVAGLTRRSHASRVAGLSVAMGRDLGMTQRQVGDLEFAALLHDLGQVALRDPLPGGATVVAAPSDQRRIADDGAAIVRGTGVLDNVAEAIAAQTTQFRRSREFGEDVPLAGRVVKVANAYDDFSHGGDVGSGEGALERIHLGLGYEYDPDVVDSLLRVLARQKAAKVPR